MQSKVNEKQGLSINWPTTSLLIVFHIGAIAAFFLFSWKWLVLSLLLNWVAGSVGVGIGFHRLLTHRGFQTPKWMEYFLTFCGCLSLEGGAINWVVTHRIHHAFTDKPGDPHSPREGVWWSHIGWILRGTAQQHPESVMRRYAPDLMKDPIHLWLSRFYYLPLALSGVALFAIGGWTAVFWGVFFRVVYGLHVTWMVNSVTHLWGTRRFQTADDSKNNWLVGLLAYGEGWHNNHHAFPRAAKHGLAWYEFDINWIGISVLKFLGLAKSIKLVSREDIEASDEYGMRKAA